MTYLRFNQAGFKTLDSLFENLLNEFPSAQKRNESFFPAVNISENEDDYQLEFNVPGRKKEDFKITFDQSILTIAFERKEEKKDETKKIIKREFSTQSFKRSFTLDEKINADGIEAIYEEGILTLTLPKVEEVKVLPKEIAIS